MYTTNTTGILSQDEQEFSDKVFLKLLENNLTQQYKKTPTDLLKEAIGISLKRTELYAKEWSIS